jgi:hypothetical protein
VILPSLLSAFVLASRTSYRVNVRAVAVQAVGKSVILREAEITVTTK